MKQARRKFWIKENVWVLLVSYTMTILVTRVLLYFTCVTYRVFCAVIIRGVHLHHYEWGYAFVVIGLFLYWFRQYFPSVLLFGLGSGFVVDEALLQTFPKTIPYWSPLNLIPIAVGLVVLNVVFLLVDDEDHDGAPNNFDLKHVTKRFRALARFAERVFFSRIGPVKHDRYSVTRAGYLATLVLFLLIVLIVMIAAQDRPTEQPSGFLPGNGILVYPAWTISSAG